MYELPTLEEMLKAGMHFGHRTSKWHPKMAPYIFGSRNGVHIINLAKSRRMLVEALNVLEQAAADGKTVLLVGSKAQVKAPLKQIALDSGMPFVNEGWLGGTITNFPVIRKAIQKYKTLTAEKEAGKLDKYTKKERLQIDREIARLDKKVGGLVSLNKAPDLMFVWDIKEEDTAVTEALKRQIPIIAICDTNVNPQHITHIIPSNDDATKTIKMVLALVGQALQAGRDKAKAAPATTEKQ